MNRARNFPTQANVRLMQLEAGERAVRGEEAEAAKLFFLSQGVTFQVGHRLGGFPNLTQNICSTWC